MPATLNMCNILCKWWWSVFVSAAFAAAVALHDIQTHYSLKSTPLCVYTLCLYLHVIFPKYHKSCHPHSKRPPFQLSNDIWILATHTPPLSHCPTLTFRMIQCLLHRIKARRATIFFSTSTICMLLIKAFGALI